MRYILAAVANELDELLEMFLAKVIKVHAWKIFLHGNPDFDPHLVGYQTHSVDYGLLLLSA